MSYLMLSLSSLSESTTFEFFVWLYPMLAKKDAASRKVPKKDAASRKAPNPLAAAGPCRDQSSKILETLAVATVMVESSCNLAWRYSTPTPSLAQWQTADLFYSWAVAAEQTAVSGKNELCYPFHEWSSFEKVLFSNKSSFLFLLLYCDILKKLS